MPPRNPELPEGTDHIINGALETGGSGTSMSASSGSDFGGGSTTGGGTTGGDMDSMSGGASSGFVGAGASDDTGGTSLGGIKAQLRDGAAGLQDQAGERIRALADTGKGRATSALDDFSQMVTDAANSIDERLGAEYGEYARRAADTVSGFADSLRNKDVDELFEDGKALVRKSPGVALGVAAVVGFTLVRLVKAGLEAPQGEGTRDVRFEPSSSLGGSDGAGAGSTGTTGA